MPSDIPTDDRRYGKLVQKVSLRYLRSLDHYDGQREKFRRLYRWWDQVENSAAAGDDFAMRLGYAFALVERMHAKITEPLFQMGLPYQIYPRRLGDLARAQNMEQIARNFYAAPNFQEALAKSKKEMCIVGHRWEFDGWTNIQRRGKMWGTVAKKVEVPLSRRPDGTPIGDAVAKNVEMVPTEVPVSRPLHYGFLTEYPGWEEVHPEPYRSTIDTGERTDMSWVVRDLGYLALEDMAREMTKDPNTKGDVPLYDFSRLLHAAGKKAEERYDRIMAGGDGADDQFGTLIIPIRDWNYQGVKHDRVNGGPNLAEAQALEDRDKIWVVQHRENGEILTIAQGKYIIHRKLDPWHVPGLKCRIENYTTNPNKNALYGKGAIEPIEGELGQLDDMHELGMQNIFRMVNKMLYVREDAIVNEDDFNPRAGGRIRIKSDQADVRAAVADASQTSPVNEMLGVESDLRGLIEFVSMEMDGSGGVQGTKQDHKTARGLQTIVNNMSPSFSRWQRQARVNECRRGQSMADMFAQFGFEKMSYRLYRPDGSTGYAEFNKDDVDTQGRGFDFLYDMDPMWGDPNQKRQMKLAAFQQGADYEKLRLELKDPNMPKVVLGELIEDVFRESGYRDMSKLFVLPDNSMTPETELQILMQGGVVTGCKGDLMHHITTHALQEKSPNLIQAMESGKAAKDTIANLQALQKQAIAQMMTFLEDPQGHAAQKLNQAGMGQ